MSDYGAKRFGLLRPTSLLNGSLDLYKALLQYIVFGLVELHMWLAIPLALR
jgi:hypothetical protein